VAGAKFALICLMSSLKKWAAPLLLLLTTASCQIQASPEAVADEASTPTTGIASGISSISNHVPRVITECVSQFAFTITDPNEKRSILSEINGLWRNDLDVVSIVGKLATDNFLSQEDVANDSFSLGKSLIPQTSKSSSETNSKFQSDASLRNLEIGPLMNDGFRIFQSSSTIGCAIVAMKSSHDDEGRPALFVRGPVNLPQGSALSLSTFLHQTENQTQIYIR
jgi:hypothetical protein